MFLDAEVMKGLWARKYAKMKMNETESSIDRSQRARAKQGSGCGIESRTSELEKTNKVIIITPTSHCVSPCFYLFTFLHCIALC